MSSGSPHVSGPVPAVSREPVRIAGPMGRGYLKLPCGHHQASLPDPSRFSQPHVRRCRTCKIRYSLVVTILPSGSEQITALVTRLS